MELNSYSAVKQVQASQHIVALENFERQHFIPQAIVFLDEYEFNVLLRAELIPYMAEHRIVYGQLSFTPVKATGVAPFAVLFESQADAENLCQHFTAE